MTWKKKKLGDVCTIISGNSIAPKIKENFYTNVLGMPYIATKDIGYDGVVNYNNGICIPKKDLSKFRIATTHSTLVCAEGGSAGRKIAFLTKECCFVNKLFSLSPHKDLLPKFIYYYVMSSEFQNQFKEEIKGLIGGVSLTKVKKFSISIPSLIEQQLIVDKLEIACREIDKTISAKKLAKINQTTLFENLIGKQFAKYFNSSKKIKLIDLCDKSRGITYGVIKLGRESPEGVPCLRTSNVKPRKFKLNVIRNISPDISKKYERTILQGGEVLVSVRGTLGGVAVVEEKMKGWNISREIALVPVHDKFVNPYLISFYISSLEAKKWLLSKTRGAGQQGINLGDLRKILIPKLEMDVQDRIVQELNVLEKKFIESDSIFLKIIENLILLKSTILTQELSSSKAA